MSRSLSEAELSLLPSSTRALIANMSNHNVDTALAMKLGAYFSVSGNRFYKDCLALLQPMPDTQDSATDAAVSISLLEFLAHVAKAKSLSQWRSKAGTLSVREGIYSTASLSALMHILYIAYVCQLDDSDACSSCGTKSITFLRSSSSFLRSDILG